MNDLLSRLLDTRLIAVLRTDSGEALLETAEALLEGGVEAIEVTFTVPKAPQIIEQVADRLGDRICLGAGTVLDPETARIAILAGARYVVSPHTDERIIELCRRYSVPVMAGALTPTETVRAWQAGADVVKIFPADTFGPAYLKALKGPLPQVRLMPTGGVTVATAKAFLDAGACALGAGSSLVEKSWIERRDRDAIVRRAREFRAAID
ncbi:MAG TPA: 2-dehydro-3-deoxyphosphogluconate aldolase [Planctomycetaceae bacterium]|nr:2-dehydro-3-deoxyphosphogluconate aldolase [Planctomycetaceae bacterium]HRE99636.1 bifunctional 4-hydroxy-2-oxoglutarate aldolase/2-dehydro-3-deoxy-phosphogluconate aldolase [Pirellulaceae bacterium]